MMTSEELVESYRKLNSGKEKTLVFQLTKRGFFSEVNNMILAILFCLDHGIEFVLYSKSWSAGTDKGWCDYFLPFCHESSNILFSRRQSYRITGRREHVLHSFQKVCLRNYLSSHDIWPMMRDDDFLKQYFVIPELGIDGDIFHAKQVLLQMVYRYNSEISCALKDYDRRASEISPFVGMHIRRGDKVKEANPVSIQQYVEKISDIIPDARQIFIFSDDYQVLKEFTALAPNEWSITSFCNSEANGYTNKIFNNQCGVEKKKQMLAFLADIHMLRKCDKFIGTYSSNVARAIALFLGKDKCYSLDVPDWSAD